VRTAPANVVAVLNDSLLAASLIIPSDENIRFYTYGDLSLEHRLQQINENVLSRFSQIDPGTDLPDEVRLTQPKRVEALYPPVGTLATIPLSSGIESMI